MDDIEGMEKLVEESVDELSNEAVNEEENEDVDVLVSVKEYNLVVGVLEDSVVAWMEFELYVEESILLFVSILVIIAIVEAFGDIERLITLKCEIVDIVFNEGVGEGDDKFSTEILVFVEAAKLVVDVSGAELAVAVVCVTL